MTVTVICDVLGQQNNGTTIAAMNLIKALKEKGHEVRVVCPDSDKRGIEGYYIVPQINLGLLNNYLRKNGVVPARPKTDVIESAVRGADVVHIMTPFWLGRAGAKAALRAGIPISAGFHAMAENLTSHIFLRDCKIANRLTYAYYSWLYRRCDSIHYPTQFLRDLYESMYGHTNGYVISNGVNEIFRPVSSKKPDEFSDKYIILYTGRFSKEKSHKILIDAVDRSKYRDKIQLILAGSGPLHDSVEQYARKLPVTPVLGFFSREQMVRLVNCADLYVHPAEIEAEGISCLEAISCGLVPIISDSPRCATKAYALDDRDTFRYNSPDDLAEKIDWWLSHPKEKSVRSREYIEYSKDRFSQRVCMDEMEKMLLETAEKRRRHHEENNLLPRRA